MDGTSVSKKPKIDDALGEVCSAITDVYSYHIHERRNLRPCRVKLIEEGDYEKNCLPAKGHIT